MAQRVNTLSMRWSKNREHGVSRLTGQRGDVLYEWGDGCDKSDNHLLHYAMAVGRWNLLKFRADPSFLEDLHARGYDLTTLKFSIRKRAVAKDGAAPDAPEAAEAEER